MLKPHDGFGATLLRDGKVLVGDVDDPSLDDGTTGSPAQRCTTRPAEPGPLTGKMVIHGRPGSATLLRDGTVLVVHGSTDSELYDPDSGTWTATGAMISTSARHVAPVLLPDGRVLVAGGGDGMGYRDAAELYDPATGTWSTIAKMHVPRGGASPTLLPNGKVLVTGGTPPVVPPMQPELYDPATETWTVTGD